MALNFSVIKKYKVIISLLSLSILIVAMALTFRSQTLKPIKVGVLHSLTGTMAISEIAVVNATLLAIEEINQKGGLQGRLIEPIVIDTQSNDQRAAAMAEKLIKQDQVNVIFGCWTSACRKTVKSVFETYNHLLIYPVQYEGLESSPNIIYTGAAPNQQIIPAVKWIMDNIGKRIFLVGSDYIFPRTANEIVRKQVEALGGQIVGEHYRLLGSKDFTGVIDAIKSCKPDVIINTINGDSNIVFFHELYKIKTDIGKIPVMSFSIAEDELRNMKIEEVSGHYAAWNYFQSIDNDKNNVFIENYKKKFGKDVVTDDPMEAAYFGVYLWFQAVKDAGSEKVENILQSIKGQSTYAPEGNVYIDPTNNHTWKRVRIGQIEANRQFKILWSSDRPIQPIPYPEFLSQEMWEQFLINHYKGWGNKWASSKAESK